MQRALPRRLFMTSGPPDCGAIALTFDDGPDPVHTPEVLDRLRAHGVRATFFLIGRKAEAQPGLVARIAREGHVVGQHSYEHGAPAGTSSLELAAETRRTARVLAAALGSPEAPRLCRPPYGKLTPAKLGWLWALRQTVVLWNRDPKDFACDGVDPIREWFRTTPLNAGDIVLMHDVHPHAAPALDALVERATAARLRFCTPVEWT